jgi:hypothetical protein
VGRALRSTRQKGQPSNPLAFRFFTRKTFASAAFFGLLQCSCAAVVAQTAPLEPLEDDPLQALLETLLEAPGDVYIDQLMPGAGQLEELSVGSKVSGPEPVGFRYLLLETRFLTNQNSLGSSQRDFATQFQYRQETLNFGDLSVEGALNRNQTDAAGFAQRNQGHRWTIQQIRMPLADGAVLSNSMVRFEPVLARSV